MFIIQAPYPLIQGTIVLRSPGFQDSKAIDDAVRLQYAMDGTPYTTVKRTGGKLVLRYNFNLSRMKALELEAFHRLYVARKMLITDFDNRKFEVTCKTNPLNMQPDKRSVSGVSQEEVSIELEFEGYEIL